MPRQKSLQPTPVELQILGILWDNGPQTARQVFEHLSVLKETAYSTTVKMLSVMLEKGHVARDDDAQPQVYRAARTRAKTQKGMLKDLVDRAYDGSMMSLMMQALSAHRASPEEVEEMRQILDQLEK